MPRPQRLLHDSLTAAACAAPGKAAVIVDGVRYSYAALADGALRLASLLQREGVQRGDRVVVFMENSWPAVVSIYGALRAGAVLTVINPQTKAEKLAYVLADSGAHVVITEGALAEPVEVALEGVPSVRCVVYSGSPAPRCDRAVAFDDALANFSSAPHDPGLITLDLAAIIYTSGSTGWPKGVMMTHQSMVFMLGSLTEYLRLGADDRILSVLPLAFDYGLYQLLMAVSLGATLVLERSFAFPTAVLQRAAQEQVTVFPVVPTIAATLLSLKKRRGSWILPSVTRVTNTAAALPAVFSAGLREIFPRAQIFAMYGLTECKRVSYLEPERLAEKPTSVGKAIPGTEVFLLSEDGAPVASGEPGILHVRGPHVMLGYWNQPELSARMLRPGRYPGERVLCTHDVFTADADGDLFFVGRTDDIIKTRGEKVSPAEVENILHRVPGVREAAVVGVPDELLGEAVRAFVVKEEGTMLGEQDVKKACLAALESFMVPRDVIFVDSLPKTGNDKVRKEDLRQVRP